MAVKVEMGTESAVIVAGIVKAVTEGAIVSWLRGIVVKTALAERDVPFMERVQVFDVPLQAPLQPVKELPGSSIAVSVTEVGVV